MGCLKLIIKIAIIVLAIIGFKSIGGWDWMVKTFHIGEKPSQEALIEKSKDVADFSSIPDEYELSKSANILGFRAVVANHDATGQKLAVVNENKALKITKEDLYLCYNNFYSPNNMFLLVVGNFPMEEAMSVIHQELDSRENLPRAVIAPIKEKKSVRKKTDSFTGNIQVPKIGMGLKIAISDLGEYDDLELDLYLTMFTTMLFGSSSLFRERARNDKLLNNFYCDWDNTEEYKTFLILAATNHPESLIDEIRKEFAKHELDEAMFNRMKKVWIANEVKMADYIDSTVHNVYDDMIRYHKVISNKVDTIRHMDMKTLEKIVSRIDFDNVSVVTMRPQEEIL